MRRNTATVISLLVLWCVTGITQAQVTDTTEVIGFDEVVEEPLPQAGSDWTDRIHLSGRFDLNLEVLNPMEDDDLRSSRFQNYHRYLFLKVTPDDRITFDAEVLDMSYYELAYDLGDGYSVALGKIWVPFGATPFHHYYGGVQGDPFTGLLLPNVWAEYGATLRSDFYSSDRVSASGDVFLVSGFDGPTGEVLRFASGGTENRFAVGGRTAVRIGNQLALWGSAMYNRFGEDNEGEILLWGGDILADYGLVDAPLLRDLRLRAAFARAEIRDEDLVSPVDSKDYWYYRYGDYVELTYRGFQKVQPRLRYGTIIDFDDRITGRDSHNWDLAAMSRIGRHVMLLAQYQINLEEINERDNDLFRFQLAFEF
ncbi:MAG: hypothetical protein HKN29_05830 [Rhodothermales bacterium]|nr:hypothetical protein [Rhodothermales bacterium]